MTFSATHRPRRPLIGLIDRFLFDTLPPVRRAPLRPPQAAPAQTANSFARPRETALDLLAGASRDTLAAVVHALEFRRMHFPAGSRTIDTVLAEIRPLLRGLRLPRLPSLSRLVWTPIQALLMDGSSERGDGTNGGANGGARLWTLPRAWLGPLWRFMLTRAGARLGELSERLQRILATIDPKEAGSAAAEAVLRSEPVAAIALEAQGEALRCLSELASDRNVAEAFAEALAENDELPSELRQADRIVSTAARLVTLMTVPVEYRDPFLSLVMGIDGRLASPGWREDREFLYDLQKDLERTLKQINTAPNTAPNTEGSVPQASAFLVMLARSLESPWPLVAALRRFTLQREGAGGRAYDTFASPEVVALMEDLVNEAERLGTRAVDALQFEPAQIETADASPDDVFDALHKTLAAGVWVHGLLSSGFLETNGIRHRRVLSVRTALTPLATNRLLPTLRTLILAPFLGEWKSAPEAAGKIPTDGPRNNRIETAEKAARLLHAFTDGPDGLRCHGLAHQILKEMETALTRIFEKMLPRQSAEGSDVMARMDALIRVTETIQPGLGNSFARRVLNRIKPAPPAGSPTPATG